MSEAIFDHNEGLTNFDYRVFICNICLIWSAIKSIPGQVYSKVFNRNNQPADGQNQNPIGSAIGNMFGFGDKSGSTPTKNSNAGSASTPPNEEMVKRQIMSRNSTNPSQQTGGNSSMAQTSQAIQQRQYEDNQAMKNMQLQRALNSKKASQN